MRTFTGASSNANGQKTVPLGDWGFARTLIRMLPRGAALDALAAKGAFRVLEDPVEFDRDACVKASVLDG